MASEPLVREVIRDIGNKENYEDCEITLKAISSDGANCTSELFVANISTLNKPTLNFFAKIATVGEAIRSKMPLPFFENEIMYYTKLSEVFTNLENKHDVPEEHRLKSPKYYGHSPTYLKEVLVLDNLAAAGYTAFDRFQTPDWQYMSCAVELLAKFHALSLAYLEEDPEADDLIRKLQFTAQIDDNIKIMFDNTYASSLQAIKTEDNKERLKKYLANRSIEEFAFNYYRPIRRRVLNHGDFKPSNIMHKIKEDGNYDMYLLDFQLIQEGCPITDLMYLIINGTDKEFRDKHYFNLVEHYYQQLRLSLERLTVDPDKVYPREDFEYDLAQVVPKALQIALFTLPMIMMDQTEPIKGDIDITKIAMSSSSRYVERLNGIINDFVKWGIL